MIFRNESHVHSEALAVLNNPKFQHYGDGRCRPMEIVVLSVTSKTYDIMNIISGMYVRAGKQTVNRAWQHEIVRRRWYICRHETTVEVLCHMGQRLHMTRILIVAKSNNIADVIEERLLDSINVFNAVTQRRDRIFPNYRCIRGGADIITYPIVWIDRYVDHNSRSVDGLVDLKATMDVIVREKSSLEVYPMVQVLRIFINT